LNHFTGYENEERDSTKAVPVIIGSQFINEWSVGAMANAVEVARKDLSVARPPPMRDGLGLGLGLLSE
jgi:hypothetical protein